MAIRLILLIYLGRRTVIPTLVGAICLAGYELFPSDPLTGRDAIPAIIVLVHSIWISSALSRLDKGEMAFLYTRGFRWDIIWWHRVFVAAASGLFASAAAFAVLWLNFRMIVQVGLANPLYPLAAFRDAWVPLNWLELYALMLSVGLYAFVRRDEESPLGGLWLAIAVLLTALFACTFPLNGSHWLIQIFFALGACIIITLLWAGQRLHRSVEVSP